MSCSFLLKQVIHIFKVFVMSSLIRCHRNCLNIFLNSRIYNFFNTSVMTKVNYFYTGSLDNTAHNVDGGIMAIKKRSSSNYSNIIFWFVWSNNFHHINFKIVQILANLAYLMVFSKSLIPEFNCEK